MHLKHWMAVWGCLFAVSALAQNIDTILCKANALFVSGRYAEAVPVYKEASDRLGTTELSRMAEAQLQVYDINGALTTFSILNGTDKGLAAWGLARCFGWQGQEDSMYLFLEEHLTSRIKLPHTVVYLNPAFARYENTSRWRSFWQKNWYSKSDEVIAWAAYLLKYGKDLEALEKLNKEYSSKRPKADYYATRAAIYESLLNYKSSASEWQKALNVEPDNAEWYIRKGLAETKAENYSQAIKDFTRGIELHPNEPIVYLHRSQALELHKDYSSAIADINTYLSFFPADTANVFHKGELLTKQGDYQKAILVYNSLLAANQSVPEWFLARGKAYHQVHTYKYAERDLGMALDLNPNLAEAWYQKGQVRLTVGNIKGACADWQKAANLGSREAKEQIINYCFR